ncbi:MAG: HEAT repeat domain-containing protein [Chroococcidiopsidaceae cyanobacterium CP_BM_ER_R8_30]|nr:HEAT repeat domain-containing protein [Chroococcidiopsidaceae cyanobacterium CP_BM_ER_R8_30]
MTDASAQTQELIRAVTQADSPARLIAAVQKLAMAKDRAGISTLIAVLGYNNPTAATIAVKGLIQLGQSAVQPLMEQLDEYNYGARAYAIRALAAIADPRALDVLITAAATDFAPSVRRAAASGLGSLHWSELASQQRQSAQAKAQKTLLSVSQDPDWSIRYAAVVGLQALSTIPDLTQPIQAQFEQMVQNEPDLAVRARVQLARARAQTGICT